MKIRLLAVILAVFILLLAVPQGVIQVQASNTLILIITSPNNGALLFQSPILVEGTIEGAASGIDSVTCNGTLAEVEGNTFSCEVVLGQGANTISVSVTDIDDNSTSSNITVFLVEY